jgi:electron transport complex protein RnfB
MQTTSLLTAGLLLPLLALAACVALALAARHLRSDPGLLTGRINALLPQTQCGQCGHAGCKPYAAFIAGGGAINRCPPGGAATIANLASLLGIERRPLDAAHGNEGPRKLAFIREDECIGCTKCIQACPVDAIVGSARHMHTVIASECTGCDLCVEPCPVDCIDMIPASPTCEPALQLTISATTRACIRCGLCNDVCPVKLLPQQLYWQIRSDQTAATQALRLPDCIECGACDWACPSHIALTDHFRAGKQQLRELAARRTLATQWQPRFEAHQVRMAHEQEEQEQRRRQRAALADSAQSAPGTVTAQDAVAAALARVQAKKAAQAAQQSATQDKPA